MLSWFVLVYLDSFNQDHVMTIQVVAITSINANAGDALDQYMSIVGPLMRVSDRVP